MATVDNYESLLPTLPAPALDQDAGPPAQPSPVADIVAALRTIAPLDGLSEEEYIWLATKGTERMGQDRSIVFREGEPACNMNFLLKGEVHVRRRFSNAPLFIGRAGSMTGKLPFSRMKNYGGEGYSVGPVWAVDIHESLFPEMLVAIPSMAQRSVTVLLDRVREVTRMEQQAEKLNALGKLAANLSHELNNPASAAQRSAASLFGELKEYGDQKYKLGNLCLPDETTEKYKDWIKNARARMSAYTNLPKGSQNPLANTEIGRAHV